MPNILEKREKSKATYESNAERERQTQRDRETERQRERQRQMKRDGESLRQRETDNDIDRGEAVLPGQLRETGCRIIRK